MNPAVVLQVLGEHVALELQAPPVTTMSKDPWNMPMMPSATVLPLLVPLWQAPGLAPSVVTNVPSLNSSRTVLGSFSLTVKNRLNVSFAQLLPHVPESAEVLANRP